MKWDSGTDLELLYAIIKTSGGKINYASVAEMMGRDLTPIAVKRRFDRLKIMLESATVAGNSAGASASKSTTPNRSTPKRKRQTSEETVVGEEAVPRKKAKTPATGEEKDRGTKSVDPELKVKMGGLEIAEEEEHDQDEEE